METELAAQRRKGLLVIAAAVLLWLAAGLLGAVFARGAISVKLGLWEAFLYYCGALAIAAAIAWISHLVWGRN